MTTPESKTPQPDEEPKRHNRFIAIAEGMLLNGKPYPSAEVVAEDSAKGTLSGKVTKPD